MRMVGRCLVCSRLISTWVSSLEPPPSTPSLVRHHRDGWFPPPAADTPLAARRSKFTSVSYVSPRPITDSSFSSRSRGSLKRDPLFAFSFRVSRSTPAPLCSSPRFRSLSLFLSLFVSFSRLVDPWRSVLFGPVYPTGFSLAESRDSGSLHPFPGENAPSSILRFIFVSCTRCYLLPPANSSPMTEGGRSFTPPASIRLLHVPQPPGFRQRPRVQSTRPSDDDASSTPIEFSVERVGKKGRTTTRYYACGVGRTRTHPSVNPHCTPSMGIPRDGTGQAFRINRPRATVRK